MKHRLDILAQGQTAVGKRNCLARARGVCGQAHQRLACRSRLVDSAGATSLEEALNHCEVAFKLLKDAES